jgi:hypothetical protein
MLKQLLVGSLVLATLSSPAAAAWVWVPTKANCVVADPTGTPLNVRSTPNGTILGALHNDTRVIVAETAMAGGQKWARVVPAVGKPGWVFRNHLDCE